MNREIPFEPNTEMPREMADALYRVNETPNPWLRWLEETPARNPWGKKPIVLDEFDDASCFAAPVAELFRPKPSTSTADGPDIAKLFSTLLTIDDGEGEVLDFQKDFSDALHKAKNEASTTTPSEQTPLIKRETIAPKTKEKFTIKFRPAAGGCTWADKYNDKGELVDREILFGKVQASGEIEDEGDLIDWINTAIDNIGDREDDETSADFVMRVNQELRRLGRPTPLEPASY